ncbi:hypothetical protein ACHAXR_012669 [Thalassiosira sp. AJA248-18]
MKRFLGLKKKNNKKVKNDADLSYRPPSVDGNSSDVGNNNNGPQPAHADDNNDATSDAQSDVTSGYRYALTAYADTIDPALSNDDGMGGGGGTLRSRSGRVRGSAGLKHRGSLIPVFEDGFSPRRGAAGSSLAGGPTSSAGGVVGASISPSSSTTTVRQDRCDTYERLMRGGVGYNNPANNINAGGGGKSEATSSWAPIPELPRDRESDDIERGGHGNTVTFQSSQSDSQPSLKTGALMNEVLSQEDVPAQQITRIGSPSQNDNLLHAHSTDNDAINLNVTQSLSATSSQSYTHQNNPLHSSNTQTRAADPLTSSPKSKEELILQPDAIYEEHYGDAYVDQLIKYLYPAGYQSMRPRSGPWKLSIIIFLLFLWLSVFIVGHCYDRGQREYNYYFDNADDAYLQEVDDDMLVMETRWCGSKPLYFMWLVSVWITVLSMSYCSIIGYVKVRDIAVANGRSQPPRMGISGRSDFYVMVENATVAGMDTTTSLRSDAGGDNNSSVEAGMTNYSSYQDGSSSRRYVPSIYQSDGTPQFWGGHIYRPTQAAVAMTNRP